MSSGKHHLKDAEKMANRIIKKLKPYCHRIAFAGSIRRGRPFVGDIEIVALPKWEDLTQNDLFGNPVVTKRENLLHNFLMNKVEIAKGVEPDARLKVFMYGGFKVDLFLPASPDHWGSVYFIRTGSGEFSKWAVSQRAQQVGVEFAGGRVYSKRTGRVIETPEEMDVFKALRMPFVPPADRDNRDWFLYASGEKVVQYV